MVFGGFAQGRKYRESLHRPCLGCSRPLAGQSNLIRVAWMSVPAALMMRPAPMAPACRFAKNRAFVLFAQLRLFQHWPKNGPRGETGLRRWSPGLEVFFLEHVQTNGLGSRNVLARGRGFRVSWESRCCGLHLRRQKARRACFSWREPRPSDMGSKTHGQIKRLGLSHCNKTHVGSGWRCRSGQSLLLQQQGKVCRW